MYMQWVTEYDVKNISDTQARKNMITMGKVDTSGVDDDNNELWTYPFNHLYWNGQVEHIKTRIL